VIGGTGLFADGTAAAPSISFAADTDTGFYRDSSNLVGFSAGGASSLRFGSAGTIYGASNANYVRLNNSGGVELAAAGSAQNITLTPSTTGTVDIFSSNDASFGNVLRVLTPTLSSGNSALILLGKAGAANQSAFINYFYSSTAALGRLDFGHNGTTGQVSLLQTGRFLIGTAVADSGALLQVGANAATGYATAGMSFGGDTFAYRSAAGTLTIQGTTNTILQFAEGASASVRIQQASGSCYIDTQSAQPIILRTNNTTALTLDSSQNATFAARSSATTAYGTAKSVTIDFTAATLTNVTRTFTVTMPSPNLAGTFLLEVGVYGNGATGSGSLLVKGYGYLGTSTLYDGTEISKVSSGNVTVSSITKGNGSFTFTVLDTANAAYVVVKYSQTSDVAITTLPTITSA
jgi:hypothetical protein